MVAVMSSSSTASSSAGPGGVANSAALAILSYCASSIIMTVTNKLVLSGYGLKMNFLLLAIQVPCPLSLGAASTES